MCVIVASFSCNDGRIYKTACLRFQFKSISRVVVEVLHTHTVSVELDKQLVLLKKNFC